MPSSGPPDHERLDVLGQLLDRPSATRPRELAKRDQQRHAREHAPSRVAMLRSQE
jgi:hypothetical protein